MLFKGLCCGEHKEQVLTLNAQKCMENGSLHLWFSFSSVYFVMIFIFPLIIFIFNFFLSFFLLIFLSVIQTFLFLSLSLSLSFPSLFPCVLQKCIGTLQHFIAEQEFRFVPIL